MATSSGAERWKGGYPKPSKTYFFINGDLVKMLNYDKGEDLVWLKNFTTHTTQVMGLVDFKKRRQQAWHSYSVHKIFDRSKETWDKWRWSYRILPPPVSIAPPGEPLLRYNSFYSDDHLFQIREAMLGLLYGRTRKDGTPARKPKDVLTEQELRHRMGLGRLVYVQNDKGEFVPIWSESI